MALYELEEKTHGELDPIDKVASEAISNDEPETEPEEAAAPEGDSDQEEQAQPNEGDEDGEDLDSLIPSPKDPDVQPLDLGNGISLKVGDKITAQHVHELSRGHMMQAEFTKKCQEVAQIRHEAEQTLNTFSQVVSNEVSNPALLFQHITPEHAIRALAAVGYDVDPRVLQQMGHGPSYQRQQQQVGYQSIDPNLARGLQSFQEWQKQQEQQQLTQSIDAEVKSQIADVKNDKIKNQMYKEILVELAINQNKPIPLIAREVRQSIKDRYAGIFTGKRLARKGSQIGRTSGSSRPISPNLPKTFEEAERSARGRLGI